MDSADSSARGGLLHDVVHGTTCQLFVLFRPWPASQFADKQSSQFLLRLIPAHLLNFPQRYVGPTKPQAAIVADRKVLQPSALPVRLVVCRHEAALIRFAFALKQEPSLAFFQIRL